MRTLSRFWNDEHGTIVSAEIILILTIAGIGMVAGLSTYRDHVTLELADLATSVSQFNHSYSVGGLNFSGASLADSFFDDLADFCDDIDSDPTDPANAGTSCVAIIDADGE